MFWIGFATALVGFIALLHKIIFAPAYNKFKWHESFRKMWDGVEATDTMREIPGVIKRLNRIDGELKSNGGGSMKDIVDKNNSDIQTLLTQMNSLTESVERMENRQVKLMRDVETVINTREIDVEKTSHNMNILWEAVESLGKDLPEPIKFGD